MTQKVGIIGFGKSGRAVATVILQHPDFTLEWVYRQSHTLENRLVSDFLGIESDNKGTIYSKFSMEIGQLLDLFPVDIIVDFSSETSIFEYGRQAAKRHVKIISAISHYDNLTLDFLKQLSEQTLVFWSPNITLGVNYLLFVARLLKKIAPWVDVEIIEEHFKQKEGISGTAVKIAESLDIAVENINSVRAGGIVGKHEIIFGFPYQTVRLIHESISREAFGNGVIFVAQNVVDKKTGYYSFENIFEQVLKAQN